MSGPLFGNKIVHSPEFTSDSAEWADALPGSGAGWRSREVLQPRPMTDEQRTIISDWSSNSAQSICGSESGNINAEYGGGGCTVATALILAIIGLCGVAALCSSVGGGM